MKFNRLRLIGFKSFVEPTELHIEPGLTGVVGPNGCGKSNLLEALRWVMGETSPKSMRGSGMEDVIFAGTNGRPSRNNAEVTLTIDNAERSAPAAYNDADTVEITRRIERDAGSAYRINGREVRARDVQLFFADASTGAHSPALVKQGQIGQLIASKPVNRRKILEEAAGITGLHSRRHEAELRLRAAETNLTRLEDVVGQIETQLSSLKRQARQATRYRNLSGHIRKAQAISLHLRYAEAMKAVTQEEERLQEAAQQVAEGTRLAAVASAAQAEAAEKIPPLRDAEAKAAAALHRLTVEREGLDAEEARAREQAARLTARLDQIGEDLEREESLVADAATVVDGLKKEEGELTRANEAQADAQAEADEAVRAAEAALSEQEAALDEASAAAADLTAKRQSLSRSVEQLQQRLARLDSELAKLADERERLVPSEEDAQHIERCRSDVETCTAAAEEAETAAVAAEESRRAAQAAEQAARDPMQEAERLVGRLSAEAKALSDLLQVTDSDLWPPLIDALQVEPGFETALGAALGDDLDVPADTAAPVHWDTLPPFDAPHPLPEGVRPLSSVVQAPAALARRLSQIGIVSQEQGKALQQALRPGQRLVTTEGDLWRWDGYTATADAPTAAAQRLAQRNRLADLEEEVREAETKAAGARETFHEARQRAEKAGEQEAEARRAARAAQTALGEARNAFAAAEKTATANQARATALTEAETRLKGDREEARRTLAESESALGELPAEEGYRERVTQLREEVAAKRGALTEARAVRDGLHRDAQQRNNRLAAIAHEVKAWDERIANAKRQIEVLSERKGEAEAELEEVAKIPARIEEQRSALLSALSEAEAERQKAADALQEAETRLKECDAAEKSTQNALSHAREERARIEALLEGARERRTEVAERIRETLDCAPEKVLEAGEVKEDEQLPTLEQIDAKLERLKRERENMGGVNLRAEEEAREFQEQLDSMLAEREDLEKAIARLRQGIGSLNREGRERLLAAFETVNENFQRLFTHLFGGGTAHLELTESDDPLEAGLEIMARPPGKRLQVMSLLSGGEQALTAMSLIFAVFLTNPSPICVLDEVDAPLDDANVERFCNLLDEMTRSTDTRFLVITHHALTMSRMNRLFGVTMAERGVSQLVSVDLQEAEGLREAS